MKNKRGFAIALSGMLGGIALILVAFVVLFLIGGVGWFLQANLLLILGGAILILAMVYGFGYLMQNPTQGRIAVFMMLFLFGIGLIGFHYLSDEFQFSIVGSSTFVKPSWARLECAPTDSYSKNYYRWIDQQTVFKCDSFTEECRVTVEHTGTSFWDNCYTGKYKECNLDGTSSCSGWRSIVTKSDGLCKGDKKQLPMLPSGKSYVFQSGTWTFGEGHAKVKLEWKPWKLYRFVGGAKWIVNSYNCDVTSSAKAKIRQEDYVYKLYRQGGEGTKWINYVDDWNYGPPTNVFTHSSHGEVYCTAGQIFDIVELRLADGKLKKVDPAYSKTLPSGDRLSGLGNRLGYVECCPNEPNCEDNFEYAPDPDPDPDDECYSDLECFNAGGPVPIDSTHYVRYSCRDGQCKASSPIAVECTTSAHCPSGEICDLSTTNYGKCITQSASEYCGDNICQITESEETCPADCETEKVSCQEQGGKWSVTTSKPWWAKIPGIGSFAGEEVTEKCLISHISMVAILILLLGVGLVIFGLIRKMPLAVVPASVLILIGAIWSALAGAGYV